jgi:hypothetical protein
MGARVAELPLVEKAVAKPEVAIVTTPPITRPRRKVFRRLNHGFVPGYAPICMDSNDPLTVKKAFEQRVLRELPSPKEGFLEQLKQFTQKFCEDHLPVVKEMEFEEWLDSTSYGIARKEQLRKVHEDLRGGVPNRKQRRTVKSFVKSEFYPCYKQARMINSRSDAFKVWSGPKFKSIENEVYKLESFIKHVPVTDRPAKVKQLKQAGRRYYQTDYTAFESHFTPELMQSVECVLYRHCLKNDVNVDKLCETLTGRNKMRTSSGVRAKVNGRRMSGDMCTSLGNGFTNLMLMLCIVEKKGGTLEGFVEGDDGLFSTDVEVTAQDFEDYGFTIKIDEVADPCEASFCGMIFSDSGEIIREPRRFMMGFGWTQSFINGGTRLMDSLERAKALSAAYETPQCPVIGELFRASLLKTTSSVPRFVDDGYHKPRDVQNVPAFKPSMDTRLLFEHCYSVTVEEQLIVESMIRNGRLCDIQRIIRPLSDQQSYNNNYVEAT